MLLNETTNNAFEVILRQALADDSRRELTSVTEIENIAFSDSFYEKIRKINKLYLKKTTATRLNKSIPKIAVTAATIVLVASLALNPSVQAFVKNIIETIFNQYTHHEFISDTIITIDNFNNDIRPEYMPSGFSLWQVNYMFCYTRLTYMNDDNTLKIEYSIANQMTFGVDNEHSSFRDVYINNELGVLYESSSSERPSYLLWEQDGYCFMITAQIDTGEIVKIAESIKIS